MAYKDLREFISVLEEKSLLKRIKVPVSPNLEITEIVDRLSKKEGPALFFERPEGYKVPIAINLFGSLERMKLALEVNDFAEKTTQIIETFESIGEKNFFERLKLLPRLLESRKFFPKILRKGPCQEILVDPPDLSFLPILKCWPLDPTTFITFPIVITRDPDKKLRNLGVYRMQIFDRETLGLHWHIHKDGAKIFDKYKEKKERMEVAVAIGTDPVISFVATSPLPFGIDSYLFAGFLRESPVELVRCKTIDLEVPATAEIILEGYVDPEERRLEGPFGDHTGYYSPADQYPVFHLNCITHRKDPIYQTTVVGKPPMEDYYLGKASERLFLPMLKNFLPEIEDISFPPEGLFHNILIVSIKKRYPGHAHKVINALWGFDQMMLTKIILVLDSKVDIHNLSEVLWKLGVNLNPKRDISITKGPVDPLDHAFEEPFLGYKMGIDLTDRIPEETKGRATPIEIEMDDNTKRLVDSRWNEYRIGDW